MKSNLMFAVDPSKEEIIVSESPKGSSKINFIERVGRHDNAVLYEMAKTYNKSKTNKASSLFAIFYGIIGLNQFWTNIRNA
jgi:hypothetical protein